MQSLKSRLVTGTALWVSLALAVSAASLSRIYRSQVAALFENELRGHLDELELLAEVKPGSKPDLRAPFSDRRFIPPRSGFFWEIISSEGHTARSTSLADGHLDVPPVDTHVRKVHWFLSSGPNGPVHMLVSEKHNEDQKPPLVLAIAVDKSIVDGIVRQFDEELIQSLLVLCAGLIAAGWASVTFGLRPVDRMRTALGAVHDGRMKHMPSDLPTEIAGLAGDVNALIDRNAEMVQRARAEADRLAHGLKTPLAILMAEAAHLKAGGQTEIGSLIDDQCQRLQRHIDHQLSVVRSSGSQKPAPGTATEIGPAARSVVLALSQLHQDRDINFELVGALDLIVACDPQDVDELLGNLVDNAAKWTARDVRISIARDTATTALIKVEDDGPGLPKDASESVFESRQRFDETMPGHGLGLAIVRDLVSAYGGRAWLEASDLGGIAACLSLPLVRSL